MIEEEYHVFWSVCPFLGARLSRYVICKLLVWNELSVAVYFIVGYSTWLRIFCVHSIISISMLTVPMLYDLVCTFNTLVLLLNKFSENLTFF